MRPAIAVMLLAQLTSCAYITKSEFEDHWDADGDGWPVGEDCNDDNGSVYPYAADFRGDGCDADCSTTEDSDGDDWPDLADCEPDDPDAYPCADDAAGDGYDSDCDGLDSPRDTNCNRKDPDHADSSAIENCDKGGA